MFSSSTWRLEEDVDGTPGHFFLGILKDPFAFVALLGSQQNDGDNI